MDYEKINTIVFVNEAVLRNAEKHFFSCEYCNPEDAQYPFDNVLDEVTGSDASITDYQLAKAARCPRCNHPVTQTTCVEWYPDREPREP
jgi:uncharacterized protein with PIN domain